MREKNENMRLCGTDPFTERRESEAAWAEGLVAGELKRRRWTAADLERRPEVAICKSSKLPFDCGGKRR